MDWKRKLITGYKALDLFEHLRNSRDIYCITFVEKVVKYATFALILLLTGEVITKMLV